jgi:methylenetetrahydrofolate dehydrogenase (NADP+)/methenyltetrahydrofolate cyclohydrolase
VFDAGTSEKGGVVVGDLDPSCFEIVANYSPVPGGIGPLTIAVLFKNLFATKRV